MRPRSLRSTLLAAAVALVLFGAIPVVVRYVTADPFTIGTFRLAVATVGVAVILAVRGQLRPAPPRDLLRMAVIGGLFFAHWLSFFFAIKISSASIGAIGLSTYGIQLLLLGALFRHHRLHGVDLVAVALAVAGAVIVVPEATLANDVTAGMLLAVASAFFYATLPLLHQRWAHIPSSTRALGQFAVALVLFLLFLKKTEWELPMRDWAGLLFLAVGSTLVGHTLWVAVTTRLSSAATSVLYYGNIPVALLLSLTLLGEPLRAEIIIGGALIIGGGVIGLGSQWRRNALELSTEGTPVSS